MKNTFSKIAVIFIAVVAIFTYIFPWSSVNISLPFEQKDYKLGLDLQGGVELDYKVDLEKVRKEEDYDVTREASIIEGLKSIIDKRVEALNINDSEINDASYGGEKHIIVQIPLKGNSEATNQANINRAKEAIGKVVKIVFKERRTAITEADIQERKNIAAELQKDISGGELFSVLQTKYVLNNEKVAIGKKAEIEAMLSSTGTLVEYTQNEVTLQSGETGFLFLKGDEYIFIDAAPSEWKPVQDSKGRILNDKYFVKSSVQRNEAFQPMVELVFNDEGAEIFGEITSRLVGQQMAIFVGGEMLTAPNIIQPIRGGKAQITGDYTSESAKKLSDDINTGVVPAPIYLTSEKTIDSKIGASSLQKLIVSGAGGFVLILVFLLLVYRLAGLFAGLALLIYIFIILFVVKVFGIVLTLASIAGLVLSLGMAIDANILIFERIKAELEKGVKLKEATEIGFKKSFSAIWDSNLTGFIVACILFFFGINLIKGFGLMLGIGIVVSFFTVMVISKIFLFSLVERLKSTKMFIGYKK